MTENFEAAELQAQLDECQRIIAAQAETIAAAHKDVAILKSHNDMMTLRAKKAEDGLAEFKAVVLAREARALVAPAAKCDGNHGGPRCPDPECWNDGQQPGRISKEDRLELVGALGLLRGHCYTGCADALQRVLDADAATHVATQLDPTMAEDDLSSEPLVRYCPGCSSVGPVDDGYQDCCPDGSEARMIPRPLAEKCRDTFSIAIRAMMADRAANDAAAQPAEPVKWEDAQRITDLPEVDELLQGFAEDPTGDAGTMIVRAVMQAVSQPAEPVKEPSDEGLKSFYDSQTWPTPEAYSRALLARYGNAAPTPPADGQAQQDEPVRWGSPRNVHELIRQLQTLDGTLAVHASLRLSINGKWRVRTKPLMLSYEQITGQWIERSAESQRAVVLWTNPDERQP